MSIEILIVDDNSDIRNILNELLIDAGYKTRVAANYNQALTEIDKKIPDVAIIDVKLDKGDNDGIELLAHIKSKDKDVPVIIITGHANIEMAVNSLKHGAFEFVEKPFDQVRLLNFVRRAVENLNLKNQNKEYENKLFSSYDLIGDSKNITTIRDQIDKISLTESRILINGPSGSGKELIARKIHKKSKRNNKPFINSSSHKIKNLLDVGIRTFIDLTEVDERPDYRSRLHKERRKRSVKVGYHRFPIKDKQVPSRGQMTDILELIKFEIDENRKVYIHCFRGLGRTGLIVGCLLKEYGLVNTDPLNDIKEMVNNKQILYDLGVDQASYKWGGNKTLEKVDLSDMPEYISLNYKKYSKWLENWY